MHHDNGIWVSTEDLMRDESFGPINGLQAVSDDDAALDLMNDSEYVPSNLFCCSRI